MALLIPFLDKDMDGLKEQLERSDIMVEQVLFFLTIVSTSWPS